MADINIERKSGAASALPWIIGLLGVALLAWWLLAGRGDDRRTQEGTYVDTTTAPAAGMAAPAPVDTTPLGTGATGYDTMTSGAGVTGTDTAFGATTGVDTGMGATGATTRP